MKEIIRFSGQTLDWVKLWIRIDLSETDLIQELELEGFNFKIDDKGYLAGRIEGRLPETVRIYNMLRIKGFDNSPLE